MIGIRLSLIELSSHAVEKPFILEHARSGAFCKVWRSESAMSRLSPRTPTRIFLGAGRDMPDLRAIVSTWVLAVPL